MPAQTFSYQEFLHIYRACRYLDLRTYTPERLRVFLVRHFRPRSPSLADQLMELDATGMLLLYTHLGQRRALHMHPRRAIRAACPAPTGT